MGLGAILRKQTEEKMRRQLSPEALAANRAITLERWGLPPDTQLTPGQNLRDIPGAVPPLASAVVNHGGFRTGLRTPPPQLPTTTDLPPAPPNTFDPGGSVGTTPIQDPMQPQIRAIMDEYRTKLSGDMTSSDAFAWRDRELAKLRKQNEQPQSPFSQLGPYTQQRRIL